MDADSRPGQIPSRRMGSRADGDNQESAARPNPIDHVQRRFDEIRDQANRTDTDPRSDELMLFLATPSNNGPRPRALDDSPPCLSGYPRWLLDRTTQCPLLGLTVSVERELAIRGTPLLMGATVE
ncbi:hypothetical protein [Burkholderia lata]|uniref:hypothetical protein n=1 Tax=Burkholderia lata (strain ATCC 17760 / DSM 23089 / LMG 22485 / NCIMB 9086 / R18194 / 383) TaxID=482957 RepID=UPI001583DA4B|nr:hypothetical protein [Burkholderia lata]